jgi:hypothetical protein
MYVLSVSILSSSCRGDSTSRRSPRGPTFDTQPTLRGLPFESQTRPQSHECLARTSECMSLLPPETTVETVAVILKWHQRGPLPKNMVDAPIVSDETTLGFGRAGWGHSRAPLNEMFVFAAQIHCMIRDRDSCDSHVNSPLLLSGSML